jgi:hypothetical protein
LSDAETLTPETFPSLGWDLLDWYETYLKIPSGPDYGNPLVLTNEQAVFIVRTYAVDRHGRFLYRRGASRRSKGWGKSPMLAGWAIGEFVAPVLFDGFDADGLPVGKPWPTPWVQIAACSEDQTGNTYSALYAMLAGSPAIDDYRIDLGRTKVMLGDRPTSVIEPVTSSAGSREGQLVTAAVLDETHLWTRSNGGRRLAATLRRNLGKMGGRSLESTNAFLPGEGSVAEDTHKAWERGEKGILYDAVEGPWVEELSDKKALRKALKVAYGDAKWVDLTRIIAEIQDPATEPADARRFYLNQLVKPTNAAVDPIRWDELGTATVPPDGTRIGVGFDGSNSEDSTVLIGCTADGDLFEIAAWEKPLGPTEWRVPRPEVHEALTSTFARYDVGLLLADPWQWRTEVDEWVVRFGEERVLIFDTNQVTRMARACDRFATSVAAGALHHDRSDLVRRHVLAMARKKVRLAGDDFDGRTPYVFVKSDTRKIDAGIAAVLALEAAMTMPEALVAREPVILFR